MQIAMLGVFAFIIVNGWGVSGDDPKFVKILRNTNLANLLVWSYWWPVIIVITIFFGRLWCTVCPMELLSSLSSRVGFSRKVPRWLRSGWVITAFYTIVLLVGIHTFAIHRYPHRMAIYMLILLAVSVVCGLIYRKRAFCSYVCPVGHLLGLYAMIAPFKWTVKQPSTCKACKSKDCIAKENRERLIGRSCTSNLYPATIEDNSECLLCTQCLKACPYDNPTVAIRTPFADFSKRISLRTAEIAFILLVAGFVVYEVLSEWPTSKSIITWLPNLLIEAFGVSGLGASFVSAVTMFVIYPAVLLLAVHIPTRMGPRISLRQTAQSLSLLLIPTMAGAHIIKALLKTVSRIPYWKYVIEDMEGVETAGMIMKDPSVLDKTIPTALAPIITMLAVILLVISLIGVIVIFKKSPAIKDCQPSAKASIAFAAIAYWLIFAATICLWRF